MKKLVYIIIVALVAINCSNKEGENKTSLESSKNKEIVEQFFQALETENFEVLLDIFHPEGRQLNPYVPAGFPMSFEGSYAIYTQYRSLPNMFSSMKFPRKIVATEDPDLFYVEFKGEIDIKGGGTYKNDYLGTFRLKDGKIIEYTEVFNPLVMAKAFNIPLDANAKPTVKKKRVAFESNGSQLIGFLNLPPDYEEGKKYPAIVVGGSWTTVKEQMAGLYAEKLAQEGYVTLAFDHRNFGESEGEPRFVEDPDKKTEDFNNAVAYLASLPMVDKEKTGGMGVCASGGYMAKAVAENDQFKAYAMVVPWFNTDAVVNAFYGGEEGINDRITKSKNAMKRFEASGEMDYTLSISDTDPSAAMFGPFEYYLNPEIGQVPNWSADKFALASWEPWLTYRPVGYAEQIEAPTLMITSQNAATPAADEEFFAKLKGPKEIKWLEGGQLDFYHKPEQVNQSVSLISDHFDQYLK
ncbi:MAG: nuclear transport factor 2 family protein [Bacteroidota bacterium]